LAEEQAVDQSAQRNPRRFGKISEASASGVLVILGSLSLFSDWNYYLLYSAEGSATVSTQNNFQKSLVSDRAPDGQSGCTVRACHGNESL
jgi:hypothetical protein